MPYNNLYLAKCRKLIEQRLGWEDPANWQNQDYEILSERIFEQTQVSLSVSTLKRVWGKVRYDNMPNPTTLNTLAAFAGYENWRDFKVKNPVAEDPVTPPPAGPEKDAPAENRLPSEQVDAQTAQTNKNGFRKYLVTGAGLLIILSGLLLVYWKDPRGKEAGSPASFSFSSQPLAKGIPNSVIFNYDASAAGEDSVFIQQSWDPKRRISVPKDKHEYTAIYYRPGFFKAKLVIGNRVVKEHDLLIPSPGWLTLVEQEPIPVYFPAEAAAGNGILSLPLRRIKDKNIPLQPEAPVITYYHVRDMDGLKNDNFTLETEVKSNFNQGSAICRYAQIVIICENDAIIIPLSIPGCVADLNLLTPGLMVKGSETDLSGFGCDLQEWVSISCEARNKNIRIRVNGKKAFEGTFPNAPARIVGIRYHFQGSGSVNSVRFSGPDGQTVFSDDF